MYGYAGKILRIDLTKGEIKVDQVEKVLAFEYIGGKGFGAKVLAEEMKPGTDPYSPSNLLVFSTGPVNGLAITGAAKFCVVFKSPLTEIWGESQCGGYFSPQLKCAGYDVLVIGGRANKPVYVTIDDDEVHLRDASHLWGKDAFETELIIKKDHDKKLQVLSIGPAGEKLVRYACITHDKGRQFGRCGGGAVFGSKKLKAIAVKGSGNVEIAQPERLDAFRKELNDKVKERLTSLINYGTPGIMMLTNSTGTLPTRNWKEGEFEGFEKINAETMKKTVVQRSKACFACSVACGKISKVKDVEVEGPEYETLFALGSLCGNDNLESIVIANEICDKLGIDTISTGNVLAFAMECYEKGIISKKDTNGIALEFGNNDAIVMMIEKIAYREGFGNILAEGVMRAAKIIGKGSEKIAVHVKGLEPPGYDPRGLKGVALAYAVSCRGACHLRHIAYRPNLTGLHPFGEGKIDRLSYKGQAEIVKELEDFYTIVDSMVLCKFVCLPTIGPILWNELLTLYTITTGITLGKSDLLNIAHRINNFIRKFNMSEKVPWNTDTLPSRFFNDKLKTGASKGEIIQKEEFEKMLKEYQSLRCATTQ